MEKLQSEQNHPFDHIALSLSGGGVRAVGYHLGTLDYLNHIGLLSEVHTLSSVSGGSLVGIGYALSLKSGEPFQDFYDNICEFLPELNTLEELLEILNRKAPPVASGSRTLVAALAQVYRENYFDRYYGDPTLDIFWQEDPEIPLKEIIFNATEFKSGIAFRFQKSQHPSVCGNGKIWIDDKFARQIRMSDIMAASSCIPVAMEPLLFPQDFHWPDDPDPVGASSSRPTCEAVEKHLLEQANVSSIPLMDGGVYDNQGITSIILSVARNHRISVSEDYSADDELQADLEPVRPAHWARWVLKSMEQASNVENQKDLGDVDLFIVSDTPVRRDPMYSIESPGAANRSKLGHWFRQLRLGTIDKIVWTITILLGVSIFALANAPLTESLVYTIFYRLETAFLGFLAILAALSLYHLRRKGEELVARTAKSMPPMGRSMWSYAKTFRLGTLIDMVALRASSMSALTARIFMNRIRQLGYSLLYSHDEFRRRIMDNNINDIKTLYEGRTGDLPQFLCEPSESIQKVVKRASTMGTKLWIDKPKGEHHDLDVLIAAGQLSTCFNVIEFLWEHHRDENGNLNENVVELFEAAKADWLEFDVNPYRLVDKRRDVGKAPGNLFWMRPEYTRRFHRLRKRMGRSV